MSNLYELNYHRIVLERVSTEYVWADSFKEAEDFGKKHAKGKTEVRVNYVYAAATTEDKPTPPGLETYKIEKGQLL